MPYSLSWSCWSIPRTRTLVQMPLAQSHILDWNQKKQRLQALIHRWSCSSVVHQNLLDRHFGAHLCRTCTSWSSELDPGSPANILRLQWSSQRPSSDHLILVHYSLLIHNQTRSPSHSLGNQCPSVAKRPIRYSRPRLAMVGVTKPRHSPMFGDCTSRAFSWTKLFADRTFGWCLFRPNGPWCRRCDEYSGRQSEPKMVGLGNHRIRTELIPKNEMTPSRPDTETLLVRPMSPQWLSSRATNFRTRQVDWAEISKEWNNLVVRTKPELGWSLTGLDCPKDSPMKRLPRITTSLTALEFMLANWSPWMTVLGCRFAQFLYKSQELVGISSVIFCVWLIT